MPRQKPHHKHSRAITNTKTLPEAPANHHRQLQRRNPDHKHHKNLATSAAIATTTSPQALKPRKKNLQKCLRTITRCLPRHNPCYEHPQAIHGKLNTSKHCSILDGSHPGRTGSLVPPGSQTSHLYSSSIRPDSAPCLGSKIV